MKIVLNKNLPVIYFIRHGETDWNRQGLIQGSVETELNDLGIQQVQDVANALVQKREELFGFQFVCSPQHRARQTMTMITSALGVSMEQVKLEPRVRELGFGIWEGKPFWELKDSPIYPADAEGKYFLATGYFYPRTPIESGNADNQSDRERIHSGF